jgi:hypothetical protein
MITEQEKRKEIITFMKIYISDKCEFVCITEQPSKERVIIMKPSVISKAFQLNVFISKYAIPSYMRKLFFYASISITTFDSNNED